MRKLLLLALLCVSTPALADINVAVVGPMTGQNATKGEEIRRGAEMAVADINAAGGVLGQQVKLAVGDDACDPKQAVAVANQMVTRGMVFIDGHYCSGSSIPASAIYADEGVLQISPGSTNPQLTEQGFKTTFRTCGRDDQQGPAAANYILKHFKDQKIAVLQDKTAYGKGIADQVRDTLTAGGLKPVMYEAYNVGDRDFNALVSRMKQAGVGVLFVGGLHTETGLLVRQMRAQGLTAQVVGGDDLMTTEYWSVTGDAGEGTLMTFGPDPRHVPEAQAVVDRFRAEKYEPEGYTLYSYATFQVWVQAVKIANSTNGTKVAAALKSHTFQTVLGPISFNDKGDIKAPTYVLYHWSKGKFAEVTN